MKEEFERVERALCEHLPRDSGVLSDLVSFVFSGRAKRIRPKLVLLVGRALKPLSQINQEFDTSKLEALAQATEMIHTASLIHDDLIDSAELRRDQRTCHKIWSSKTAVLAGDFLFARACCLLSELDDNRIYKLYSKVFENLCLGEIEQAGSTFNLECLSMDAYLEKSRKKTAELFRAAAQGACILNKSDDSVINSLGAFAENFGILFQVIDDLLDFNASEKQVGKPVMSDLRNGIFTMPVIIALKDTRVKDRLSKILTERDFENEHVIKNIKALLDEAEAFKKTFEACENYANDAIKSLNILPKTLDREELEDLITKTLDKARNIARQA